MLGKKNEMLVFHGKIHLKKSLVLNTQKLRWATLHSSIASKPSYPPPPSSPGFSPAMAFVVAWNPGSRCHHWKNGASVWMMIKPYLKNANVCKPTYWKWRPTRTSRVYIFELGLSEKPRFKRDSCWQSWSWDVFCGFFWWMKPTFLPSRHDFTQKMNLSKQTPKKRNPQKAGLQINQYIEKRCHLGWR